MSYLVDSETAQPERPIYFYRKLNDDGTATIVGFDEKSELPFDEDIDDDASWNLIQVPELVILRAIETYEADKAQLELFNKEIVWTAKEGV